MLIRISCALAILAAPLLVVAQTHPATAPATTPAATEPSAASQQAAAEIIDFVESNDDLHQKMTAAGMTPPLHAEDIDKLEKLLPPDLAAKFPTARPALLNATQKTQNSLLGLNLKYIGLQLTIYAAAQNDKLPTTIADLLPLDAEGLRAFARPGTAAPPEIVKGDAAKQEAWIKANTPFVLLHMGDNFSTPNPDQTIIGGEDPAQAPAKPNLWALYADGHVSLCDRKEVETAIKNAGAKKAP